MSLTITSVQNSCANLSSTSTVKSPTISVISNSTNTTDCTDTLHKIGKNGEEKQWTNKNGDSKYRITSHNGVEVIPYIQARNSDNQPYTNEEEASKVLGLTPETERSGFLWLNKKNTGRYNYQEKIHLGTEGIMILTTERSWLEWDPNLNGFVEMYEHF